jgi:hypothetical protein
MPAVHTALHAPAEAGLERYSFKWALVEAPVTL